MNTEDNVVLGCVGFTDSQHDLHSTPSWGEEEEIISGAHESPTNVAAKSGHPQLLQEVIKVQVPEKT